MSDLPQGVPRPTRVTISDGYSMASRIVVSENADADNIDVSKWDVIECCFETLESFGIKLGFNPVEAVELLQKISKPKTSP